MNATERETRSTTIQYSLVTSTSRFVIDPITGIITTNMILDREDQSSYVLTVQASDSAAMPLSSFVQVSFHNCSVLVISSMTNRSFQFHDRNYYPFLKINVLYHLY